MKTKGEDRYQFHCPIRHPSRDIAKNDSIHLRQVFTRNNVFLRCPAKFCEFRIEILPSNSNRMCAQNGKRVFPFFFFFFFSSVLRKLWSFFFFPSNFSGRHISHMFRQKPKGQAFHLLVGACSTSCQKFTS